MAVTQLSSTATPCRLLFVIDQDGGAGTTLTITNAALVTAAAAQPANSPIRKLIVAVLANQAAARLYALGCQPEDGSQGGVARTTPRNVGAAMAVDANVSATLLVFDLVATAAAQVQVLEILAPHSVSR